MRRRAGQGLGNDRELLHMLTMDTGKKGHGGHQENIQLPETEGNLRLGFPQKYPKRLKRRFLVEQSPSLSPDSLVKTRLPGQDSGRKSKLLAGVGRIL